MSLRKRKNKRPSSKSASEDLTRIIEHVEFQSDNEERGRERGRGKKEGRPRETDPGTRGTPVSEGERESPVKQNGPTQKTSKEVHIVFLPDRYQTLIEEVEDSEGREEEDRKKEEEEKRKKEKHKKYRKNVRKALRFGWRCLVAGLQSLASGYATPLSAAATLVIDVHRTNRQA
ncbi:vicilin-like seed storage protein At2g18540 [Coregonus clupeaformis]|uniref:vicilin-like seed storage protein At2g18540 n=1 Tax=Coregonus clupeaformis TaxID=59861 RepID=UPI001E1C5663|nr:vicilin-like seed storage protein At2g18540 [Coregonus clupeaformis]